MPKRQEPEAPRDPAPVIPPAEDSKKATQNSSHGEATHPKTWEFGLLFTLPEDFNSQLKPLKHGRAWKTID